LVVLHTKFSCSNPKSITTGAQNIAIGNDAGALTTGAHNTAVGNDAWPITTGDNNVAVGRFLSKNF
tara:strand:- start:45 stop:242 length:198 start_codon:yes stop_codon:yes gene_type:complete